MRQKTWEDRVVLKKKLRDIEREWEKVWLWRGRTASNRCKVQPHSQALAKTGVPGNEASVKA